uniref:Retrovirus-related Pol polyprotein from transposon TNT 1-94 n=1 Tax=Tanacetum cinerariifolium TaxID=118510 RepID=A0A6L2L700_TANCI|nr:hypothetical protein [Tanacetum cinerariifolium]
MCHIIGIEPQFENVISNGPFISMAAGQKKPEAQWTADERKAANLDQRLKSLIVSVLPDDQMNSVINFLTTKSTYKALMKELVNDGIKLSKFKKNTSFISGFPKKRLSFCQTLRNTNHVKDFDLASLFGDLKYEENLINSIYETEKNKSLVSTKPLSTTFFSTSIIQDFQDSPNDEEDTRSSYEYLNDLEKEYQARALLSKSKRFFKKGTQRFSSKKATDQTKCHKWGKKGHFTRDYWSKTSVPSCQSPFQSKLLLSSENKPELRQTKDFEAKYHKVKAKLALLSLKVSSYENEVTEVKALMALTDEERVSVGKESARNDYLCIDLNYVEEQRNNLLSKYRNLVQELNTCEEQLLVLKQAKLDLLTMQHVNTEILKENQNLRLELKELTSITETWLNSSNKVNQCINEQIPTQKKKILGIDQLTEDTSRFGSKGPVFVKSLADNSDMSITSINIPKSYETEDSILPTDDTSEVPSNESQRNTTDPSIVVSNSSVTDYDSADESSICSTPFLSLKKLDGVEPVSGPKTIKSILKSKSTFKAKTLKGVTINKPSSAPARRKSSSASKTNSTPAGKLKNVKIEDDPSLAIVMKELNELKLQISKKKHLTLELKMLKSIPLVKYVEAMIMTLIVITGLSL